MTARTFCAAFLSLCVLVGCKKTEQTPTAGQPVIAVVPKSTDHPYWNAVKAGAMKGGQEANVQINWNGPNTEADRQAQIRIVADMVGKGVDALCIAPNDQDALVNTIVETHKKIPVVVFDSGVNTQDFTAYIATDNHKGGELAGEEMLRLLGDVGGKLAVIRGIAGSESTTQREEGFIQAVKKNPKVSVVELRGDNAELKSKQASADILTREGDIAGFFGPSEPVCKGILGALQDAGKTGKIKFVGFDGGDELARGLDQKQIDALVVQRPVLMGELAVKAAVAAIHGQTVEKIQRIAPMLITQQNKDQPEIRELLQPKTR
ncbi:MAG TPA: substrate-binding domain-containing protein [Tepidisphaeraceae bacterium]|jgi:ribose transport system substrate-binding protein